MRRLCLVTLFIASVCLWSVRAEGQRTISELLRDPERVPADPIRLVKMIEPDQMSLEEMTRRATAVVEATLLPLRSYINVADTEVWTDYEVVPQRVLAGHIRDTNAVPGRVGKVILTVPGGEVVRDGVTVQLALAGMEAPSSAGSYLVFVRLADREPGVYEILNGALFSKTDDTLRPLANDGQSLFPGLSRGYADVARRVRAAGAVR